MGTTITRADLAQLVGMSPKLLQALERLFVDVGTAQDTANSAGTAAGNAVASTGAIQSATVLTLSPNAAFNNERVLVFDPTYFSTNDTGPNGQFYVTFVPPDALVTPGPYTDDAAAAAGGVEVGDIYKQPLGVVVWRQV